MKKIFLDVKGENKGHYAPGIVSQKDVASLGRIAGMILLYYCVTTIFACMVGIGTTTLLKPGVWGSLSGMQGQEVSGTIDITIQDFFTNLFSDNIFASFTQGNILQTLVIAIIIGICLGDLAGTAVVSKLEERREAKLAKTKAA